MKTQLADQLANINKFNQLYQNKRIVHCHAIVQPTHLVVEDEHASPAYQTVDFPNDGTWSEKIAKGYLERRKEECYLKYSTANNSVNKLKKLLNFNNVTDYNLMESILFRISLKLWCRFHNGNRSIPKRGMLISEAYWLLTEDLGTLYVKIKQSSYNATLRTYEMILTLNLVDVEKLFYPITKKVLWTFSIFEKVNNSTFHDVHLSTHKPRFTHMEYTRT